MLPAILGAVAGIGSMATGIANAVNQTKVNRQNYDLQKEQMEYNKYFSENQHAIAAKDLENAGLSKTLAAGSANSMQSMSAPQQSATDWSQVNPMNALSQMAQLASTLSSARLANEQARTQMAQQEYIGQQTTNARLDSITKDFNNNVLGERYDMEKGRYGIEQGRFQNDTVALNNVLSDSEAKRLNIYKRLEMDKLLAEARIGNIDQATANAKLQYDIDNWDYTTARNNNLPTKNRGMIGDITNIVGSGFQGLYDATIGNITGKRYRDKPLYKK